jgi:hypothetical protein
MKILRSLVPFVASLGLLACTHAQTPSAAAPVTPPPSGTAGTAGTAETSGTSGTAGTAASSPSATPAAAFSLDSIPQGQSWDGLSHDERLKVMKTMVAPTMAGVFQGYNAKEYAHFNCMSCHGDGVMQGNFTMPNPDLPKLPATPDGFKALAQKKPAIMGFMMNEVKPSMAKMLGLPEYDPSTGKGFGCLNCHTTASK